MALIATIGGSTSNSFGTREEADSFFADRLYTSTWDVAEDDEKDKALVTACFEICQLRFFGEQATTTQALPWPRLWVRKIEAAGMYTAGVYPYLYYASDEIPVRLKQAQFIYAHELLKSDSISERTGVGIRSLSTGTVSVAFEPSLVPVAGKVPAEAMRLLRGLVITGGRTIRA
jgi:hypothetical protein